ncbi:MAG: hypothetical protein JSR39_09875 [Verrucomicrobia bacterium]|nr:hypothetical protein [Verrucomicrobiota bacterium]
MMPGVMPPMYELLLSVQGAMLKAVTPQLRAVTVDINPEKAELSIVFFYDGEITDELFDLASIAAVEVDIFPFDYVVVGDNSVQLDFPKEIPIQGRLAYLRHEPNLPTIKMEDKLFLLKEPVKPLHIFCLDMQEALLGKVSPALRRVRVSIDPDHKKLISHFYYDGEISDVDLYLAKAAIHDSIISFPDYVMESQILRIDYPNEIPADGCRAVYWRWENKY